VLDLSHTVHPIGGGNERMEAARNFEKATDSLRRILRDGRVATLFLLFNLAASILASPRGILCS